MIVKDYTKNIKTADAAGEENYAESDCTRSIRFMQLRGCEA